jgi:HAD superfamily hydrolase (TIGR01490 family)
MDRIQAPRRDRQLTLFDLDNTLIAGDSDYGWAQFLIAKGVLDAEVYEARNAEFFAAYKAGTLDIRAFLDFQLKPLAAHDPGQLTDWRDEFVQGTVRGWVLPAALAVVDERTAAGDLVAVVTATNSFITRPIADLYGIEHLLATEPETVGGRFTGRVTGEPCFQAGKLRRLVAWLAGFDRTLGDFARSAFYSDSRNDLALLSAVTCPVAVDPDPVLEAHARAQGWPVVSWR